MWLRKVSRYLKPSKDAHRITIFIMCKHFLTHNSVELEYFKKFLFGNTICPVSMKRIQNFKTGAQCAAEYQPGHGNDQRRQNMTLRLTMEQDRCSWVTSNRTLSRPTQLPRPFINNRHTRLNTEIWALYLKILTLNLWVGYKII